MNLQRESALLTNFLIALRTPNRRFHWFFAIQTTLAFGTWVSVRFFQI